jgi:hypothetical protein
VNEVKVLAHVAKLITETRADQENFLSTGRAADYAEYRHVCGIIRGLNSAEQIIKDLVQRLEQNDE